MKHIWPPQDQVFWYLNRPAVAPCMQNIEADVAIIGGGMAGLAAAQAWNKRGKKVVLLEQYYCGSGASGKSSGFITPNAELSLSDFSKKYNAAAGRTIWDFITSGCNDIRSNIQHYNLICDYNPQDSLVLATSKGGLKEITAEHASLENAGYKSALYTALDIQEQVGSKKYFGGVRYEDTFGINAYQYCQEMKKQLQQEGVLIFEETPVTAINGTTLITSHANITAEYRVVCGDRFLPDLGLLTKDIYHAQTFLLISQQLTDEQIAAIFPNGKLMVWDTELIYNYFRVTGDNRLLLGGGSVLTTYASKAQHEYKPMINKLTNYFNKKFPEVAVQFEYNWTGLIGLSKDIAPIAGPDKDDKKLYYVAASAGLPIASALGRYSAESMLDGANYLEDYFSPYRSFPIGGIVQSVMGTKISFALSNFWKMNIP